MRFRLLLKVEGWVEWGGLGGGGGVPPPPLDGGDGRALDPPDLLLLGPLFEGATHLAARHRPPPPWMDAPSPPS